MEKKKRVQMQVQAHLPEGREKERECVCVLEGERRRSAERLTDRQAVMLLQACRID